MSETKLTTDERTIASAFAATCDQHEWGYCRAHLALGGEPTEQARQIIRGLVTRGVLYLERGGQDDDGRVIGGTFYGITKAGRAALVEEEKS